MSSNGKKTFYGFIPGRGRTKLQATTHDAVLQVVKQTKPANLESVELFDVFRGKNVPAGQKSLAYAFTYRNMERTLTDAEVSTAHEKLVEQFKKTLQAAVRARIAPSGRLVDVCTGTGKQTSLEAYLDRPAILGMDDRGGAMALLIATEWMAGQTR